MSLSHAPHTTVGLRLAQVGAALHIVGGVIDQTNLRLLPFHEAFLGYGHGQVPEATAVLVLTLLHAIGYGLIGIGIALLVLLARLRDTGDPKLGLVAVILAVCGEGAVGAKMLGLGFSFGWIPLTVAALVVLGVDLHVRGVAHEADDTSLAPEAVRS